MPTPLPDDVADAWAEVFWDLYRKDCEAEEKEAGSPEGAGGGEPDSGV